jgi:ATP adenylyltransferase
MVYIGQDAKEEGCILCNKARDRDPRESLVLAHTDHTLVLLNKYPYNNGHLLLAPRRHERNLSDLSSQEYADFSESLRRSVAIVREALNPGGINLGMNLGKCAGAGIDDHLHWHIVPRWEGDTNFMPVSAEVRVMPQHLLDSYDRLAPYFTNFTL